MRDHRRRPAGAHYSYLHCTLNSLDGMDFALLYYGDLFDPHYEEPGRRYLYIEGTLRFPAPRTRRTTGRPVRPGSRTDTVGLVLCSDHAPWPNGSSATCAKNAPA